MEEHAREELLMQLIERPETRQDLLENADQAASERQELLELARVADAVWLLGQEPPALADDPVAAMLGLVPEPDCQLNPSSLARARKRARLSPSKVSASLRARGWEFSDGDVFRWETRAAADVPPAVVQALAEICGTTTDALIVSEALSPAPVELDEVRGNAIYQTLVERWSSAVNVSRAVAASMLESRMLTTVHRGDQPDLGQLLVALEALVSAVENKESGA